MELEEEIRIAHEEKFPGSDTKQITWDEEVGRVGGLILWEGFARLKHIDRQKKIFKFLRDKFKERSTQISIIFAYSPEEYEVMKAA